MIIRSEVTRDHFGIQMAFFQTSKKFKKVKKKKNSSALFAKYATLKNIFKHTFGNFQLFKDVKTWPTTTESTNGSMT